MDCKKRHRLKIDTEFQVLIPPLSGEERQQLETSVLRNGCLDPIVIWNDTILDGHYRYSICTKHGIPYDVVRMEFSFREEAVAWICANQLEKHSISEETRKYLIGREYEARKIINANNAKNKPNGRNTNYGAEPKREIPTVTMPPTLAKSNRFRHVTAQRIADENHISWATVEKYASYSKALDLIKSKAPEILLLILSGRYRIAHESILLLSKMGAEEIQKAFRDVVNGNTRTVSISNLKQKTTKAE